MSNNGIQMNNQQPTNLGFGNFFGGNVPSINMNGGNQPPQEHVKMQFHILKWDTSSTDHTALNSYH